MIVASLPMYDWPEIRHHTDKFWQALARNASRQGKLTRGHEYAALWANINLSFSQTCGYPYTHEFKGLLNYIATPHYVADGCFEATYCSIIYAREKKPLEEFYGSVLAMNNLDSMSGMLAAGLVFAAHKKKGEFFRRTIKTGSHRNSMAAVRTKYADVCAIDSVCVALAKIHAPQELQGLVEIARSPAVPALPYVTKENPLPWREALAKTFADVDLAQTRAALLLNGFSILPNNAYDMILELEREL
jgi:ABC-type phosphate/phosphonate transport system substrate-binding protein